MILFTLDIEFAQSSYVLFHFRRVEGDVVDRIMANLIKQTRSRRVIIKKMKEMGLIMDAKSLAKTKRSSKIRPPKEWSDHEVEELQRIFPEVRESSGLFT